MSLIYCPECGHEISNSAVACPNCGRPINATPVVERKVVTGVVRKRDGFPTWAYFVIGTLGLLLLFTLFIASRRGDDDELANQRIRVNANLERAAAANREALSSAPSTVTDVPSTGSSSVTVPGSSAPVTAVPMPSAPGYSSTTVPGSSVSAPPPTKGTVVIDAKLLPRSGNTPQPVRNVRFYLLDKDIETILSEADLEPIEGQTLTNSFGLSLMYPSRYGDFNREAMAALKRHVKYSGQTDGSGKAQLGNVDPDSYYLFGMTKGSNGFAVWSAPVSVVNGENLLNLSPQRLTEVQMNSGE